MKYWIKQYYDLKLSNHCSKWFERSKLGTLVLYSLSLLKFIITLQSKRNDTLCPRYVFKLEYLNTENSICSAYVQICSPFLMMYFIFLHVLMGKKSWVPIYRKFEIKKTNQSCWFFFQGNIISLKNLNFLWKLLSRDFVSWVSIEKGLKIISLNNWEHRCLY